MSVTSGPHTTSTSTGPASATGTFPTGLRRVLGPLTLPAMFVCLLATGPLDPFSDDSAKPSAQLPQMLGHVGDVRAMSALELVAAALMVGVVLFFVGGTRGRGRGLGNAGAVIGTLGTIGLSFIAVHHLVMAALADLPPTTGTQVLDALDAAVGPGIFPLFFAAPAAILLFVIAGFRAGFVPLPALALGCAFYVGELVPGLPHGELVPLLLGLVASTWIAVTLLRRPGPGHVA
jgi:hypothetical protein